MPFKPNLIKFWHELKRRKVFRVLIVYVASGFAIIEFVDIVTEPLTLPDWALTLVIILVAIGFPVALIFAWAYDSTPTGIEKTAGIDTVLKSQAPLQEKSIIVLPLEDISPDKDNEYFADGLTEEITADLSLINDLLVISRSSAMTFKGTKKKLIEIAHEVNVRYVLEGSVRKAGNKLRITAQLIDAQNDMHLWAEKYDGILDDVFDLQEKVSQDIVNTMKLKLTPDEKNKITLRPINNFEAYDFYLRAYQEFWEGTEEALNRGLHYLKKSADIVGDNDLIYSAMALIYIQYVNMGIKHEDYIIKSQEYVQKALALNPESSTAYHVLGFTAARVHGNPFDTIRYLKHALAIEPTLLPSLFSLIGFYCYCGQTSAARPFIEKLKRMDPLSFQRHYFEGLYYFFDGKFEEALDPFRRSYNINPKHSIHWFYAWALAYCNEYEQAISIIDKGMESQTKVAPVNYSQILKFTLMSDKEKVLQLLTPGSQKTVKRVEVASYFEASMLASLGETEKALEWLNNSVDRGFLNYPMMAEKDPFLESIRGEEQFKKLMEKVKPVWENFEV